MREVEQIVVDEVVRGRVVELAVPQAIASVVISDGSGDERWVGAFGVTDPDPDPAVAGDHGIASHAGNIGDAILTPGSRCSAPWDRT
jgi:glycerate-2-kinase